MCTDTLTFVKLETYVQIIHKQMYRYTYICTDTHTCVQIIHIKQREKGGKWDRQDGENPD